MATYNAGGFPVARWLRRWAVAAFVGLFRLLDHRPRLARVVFALLRLCPVWRIGHTVLVTRDRQAREVLARDDDFPLPEERAAKFLTGAFVLGMTRTPQFQRDRRELQTVVSRTDRDRIRELAVKASHEGITAAGIGPIDIVADLTRPVGVVLIRQYFGITTATVEFADQLRVLGAMVASPCSQREDFRETAGVAAQKVYERIDAAIDAAETRICALLDQGRQLPDDATVLQRLVYRERKGVSGLDREAVRRNITGVLLPGAALVSRAFATALVQLLKKKRLRAAAIAATAARDLDALEAVLLEAMRFHPVFPLLPRFTPHDTVIEGFRRETRIRAGRDVYVAVGSAMFDPQASLFSGHADGPSQARVRAEHRHHYRHFGGGMHECLGQHIALPQMAAMLAALPQLDCLTCGAIEYNREDGISPDRLLVTVRRAKTKVFGVPISSSQANGEELERARADSR
jgi:cytochrome P450